MSLSLLIDNCGNPFYFKLICFVVCFKRMQFGLNRVESKLMVDFYCGFHIWFRSKHLQIHFLTSHQIMYCGSVKKWMELSCHFQHRLYFHSIFKGLSFWLLKDDIGFENNQKSFSQTQIIEFTIFCWFLRNCTFALCYIKRWIERANAIQSTIQFYRWLSYMKKAKSVSKKDNS